MKENSISPGLRNQTIDLGKTMGPLNLKTRKLGSDSIWV